MLEPRRVSVEIVPMKLDLAEGNVSSHWAGQHCVKKPPNFTWSNRVTHVPNVSCPPCSLDPLFPTHKHLLLHAPLCTAQGVVVQRRLQLLAAPNRAGLAGLAGEAHGEAAATDGGEERRSGELWELRGLRRHGTDGG